MRFSWLAIPLILLGAGCSRATPAVSDASNQPEFLPIVEPTPMPSYTFPGVLPSEQITAKQVRIKTAKGDMVFELFADTAPKTVSNFVYLASQKYYDGVIFHRREEGFVIQGGDPQGNGTGGPGYTFEDELTDSYTYQRGTVAMANRGPNTNGSQFFIMLADYPLPKNYSIFGRVTEGLDVVDKIAVGDEMLEVSIESKP